MQTSIKTITITMPTDELERITSILADTASDMEDDGREGDPDAQLIWKLFGQLKGAK